MNDLTKLVGIANMFSWCIYMQYFRCGCWFFSILQIVYCSMGYDLKVPIV